MTEGSLLPKPCQLKLRWLVLCLSLESFSQKLPLIRANCFMTYSYLPVHIEFPLPRLLLLCRRMPPAMAMRRKGMRRSKQSREVVRVSFWANKDVEQCKMKSKVVNAIKAVKIDKCFSLYKLQRGIVGLLWNRRKLWGTVRRVCNATSSVQTSD